jgi:citrate lyase subunit beta / citryl-CoA lyase
MTGPAFSLGPALLFCPADRPDRYGKALDRSDAVILDLEDGTASHRRDAAREAIVASSLDPGRVVVRVNPAGTADFGSDLDCIRQTDYRYVMLPKAERPSDLDSLGPYSVIALCESAAGISSASALAAVPHVCGLMLGAEDLIASLGGTSSRHSSGRYRDLVRYARSTVALAAAAHGISMIDAIHIDVTDVTGLAAEAGDAAALGFAASACIHPDQVETIRTAYRPSDEELGRARRILSAAAQAGGGAILVDGQMIDGPLLQHARTIVRRAVSAANPQTTMQKRL